MRRLGIVAVGFALVVGIILGAIVGNPFDGKASASTAAGGGRLISLGSHTVGAGQYFRFPEVETSDCRRVVVYAVGGQDITLPTWIDTSPDNGGWDFKRDGVLDVQKPVPFESIGEGAVNYPYMAISVLNNGAEAEISAWIWCVTTTSPSYAVGGFAEYPAAAGTDGSGMGGATYAVLAGAAAGVLAFAVLATLTVRKWPVR